jgi:ribosomal protein S14
MREDGALLERQVTPADLRAKIRELIASGVLPKEPPPITREAPAPMPNKSPTRTRIGSLHARCTICGEPGPHVRYFYIAGRVVSVHAACDALWKEEQA